MEDFITTKDAITSQSIENWQNKMKELKEGEFICEKHGKQNRTLSGKCRQCESEKSESDKKQSEWVNRIRPELILSGIGDEFIDAQLHTYIPRGETQATALKLAKRYIESDKLKMGAGLIFLGNPGVGKTMLANCIAKELFSRHYENGYKVRYIKYYQLNTAKYPQNKIEDLCKVNLLVIDEIGIADTDNKRETLFEIVDQRWDRRLNTILLSNLNKQSWDKFVSSPAMVSRLEQKYYTYTITGNDYRLKNKLFGETK